jgi:addiction module HigA family antidote
MEGLIMLPKNRVTTHPGAILKEEFLVPLGITINAAAEALGIHRVEVSEIVNGHRALSPRMSAKLAKCFGTSVEFWSGLQADYDTTKFMQSAEGRKELAAVKPLVA